MLCAVASCCVRPSDGEHVLHIYTTNDIHGCYFDSLYVGDATRPSLMAVSELVNEARAEYGEERVILVDAGDFLQGDNAAYFYNFVETGEKHVYARMAEYMDYDAVVVGNHDVETGHAVYDRISRTMKVPFLAANAVKTKGGGSWFDEYALLRRDGLKVLVLGCTNANIKGWLSPKIWEGMRFESLLPFVQEELDKVVGRTSPDVVIVAVHSGSGPGDGSVLESQGRDLLYSLKGVDVIVCAHDHSPYVEIRDSCVLINSGSHCRYVGHGIVTVEVEDGKVVGRKVSGETIPVDKTKVDTVMEAKFRPDYEAVKAFTTQRVGSLAMPLRTRDAYRGMSDYVNLIHTVCLGQDSVQVSIAAPLTFDGTVEAGELIYRDLFTIYPFENQLFIVRMTGDEIRRLLEYAYDRWICTPGRDGHVLRIVKRPDPRTGTDRWSFVYRPYNFDSAAGLVYTVDVTKPCGERVAISSLADGSPFDGDAWYNVGMTSFRACGGGHGMSEGAGIDTDKIDERIVDRRPEIRELIYDFLKENPELTPELVSDRSVLGNWSFVPALTAGPAIENDLKLLFPDYGKQN